ncbi:rod shape-determining protein MreC [bacterium]|nr:rod shape-determining protein MreC [bacterium]
MVSRGIRQIQFTVSVSWRRRVRIGVLVVLVFAGLAIAALEKYRSSESFAFWTRGYEKISPILDPVRERTRRWVMTALKLNDLWAAEAEKDRLSRELAQSKLQNDLLFEQLGRLQRLSGLGRWAAPPQLRFVPADVTGLITSDESMLLTINRGRADGIGARDPVVALKGLVGLIRSVQEHTAQVQAITDPMSVVGAATRDTRARGALYGRGRNKPLEFLPENEVENFNVGSRLITSRFENSNFPKGITIGVIEKRDLNLYGIPVGVVRSAVAFDTLEEVLVIVPNDSDRDDQTTASLGAIRIVMPTGDELANETTVTLAGSIPTTGTLHTLGMTTQTLRNMQMTTKTLQALKHTTSTLRSTKPTTGTARAIKPTTSTLRRAASTTSTSTRRRDSATTATRRRSQPRPEATP